MTAVVAEVGVAEPIALTTQAKSWGNRAGGYARVIVSGGSPRTERSVGVSANSASSTLPRRQLGRYLRDWRTQAGLTIAEAARLMEWGATTLQRLEKGQADRIRTVDVRALCRLYGIPDELRDALVGLAQQVATQGWWHAHGNPIPESFDVYTGLEAAAREVHLYHGEIVPSLLQTPDYTRALLRLRHPGDTDDAVEQRVQARVQRQALILRKVQPATLDAVLHESALRHLVIGPKAMAAQLRQLADWSTRPTVALRVLPHSAGVPLGHPPWSYTMLDFGTDGRGRQLDPPIVYVPALTGDLYLESADDIHRYHLAHERLRAAALEPQQSRLLLRQLAKECAA
ncbi:helix-turn-helix domain-containing protein [Nocardia puris]|nr:helix-turn-helix domain-containing protein [Nocardia puris]